VALAEMAMTGDLGASIDLPSGADAAGFLFGEDQGRYVVTTTDADAVLARAKAAGVPVLRLGTTGGGALKLNGGDAISIDGLKTAHEAWLPQYMAGSLE
jgi:phosphoribosylformylglycinamidine (FGAM) synthase-like enzyme